MPYWWIWLAVVHKVRRYPRKRDCKLNPVKVKYPESINAVTSSRNLRLTGESICMASIMYWISQSNDRLASNQTTPSIGHFYVFSPERVRNTFGVDACNIATSQINAARKFWYLYSWYDFVGVQGRSQKEIGGGAKYLTNSSNSKVFGLARAVTALFQLGKYDFGARGPL